MLRCCFVLLLLGGLGGLLGFQERDPDPASLLQKRLEDVMRGPDYKHARWGLLVVDAQSGEQVYAENPDQLFVPASTTKLFSVAAALLDLGSDHVFVTPVRRQGEVNSAGELHGNLILVASGDPSLGGRTGKYGQIEFKDIDHTYANGNNEAELTEADPLAGLNELARQVAAAGIRRVRGDVLIDDRLFEVAQGTGSGPQRLTPIMVNDNLLDFVVTPTEAGKPAEVKIRPTTAGLTLDVMVETVEKGQAVTSRAEQVQPGRIVVRGQIPVGHKPLVRVVEVPDPVSFARSHFIGALERAGVRVDASPLAVQRPEALPSRGEVERLPEVAELRSLPFKEHAKLILKVSHNLHAGTLPILLATRQGGRSLPAGLRRQGAILEQLGLDIHSFSIGSGAGGSPGDQISPRAQVELLKRMRVHPLAEPYREALPILGVDGTLAKVVDADSPARGRVQAKTGTYLWQNGLSGRYVVTSKALAGYLTTASGRELIFGMMVNNTHIKQSDETKREGRALGRLCEILHDDRPR
ncbi:MAG TPA: D-alanyl-D-alanine carboxypeptidase/D-alanyl-D-alanine-endopeptidase [Gemmatales bacterium]|nr:D-alanyl-D-alanine carboxypeptidase/D-alanyl-D-alanine-endopeptidase [Gemmatales bacterium]HMP60124.1 D-alanyl-D-alanine carboxypeptidase/D-alanyl-D-alanine-endopeptidase [Gemmatales bacterium]